MGYKQATISKKLPKTTIILAIVLVFILIGGGIYIIGGIGTVMGILNWLGAATVATLVWLGTPQFAVGAILVTGIIGLYLYRKSAYAKRKVLMPTGTMLPQADRLAQPVFGNDTKVETST